MKKILKKVRANEWWKPKAGFLFGLLFFTLLLTKEQLSFILFLKLFFLSFITLTAIGVLGHLLNDLGDIEADEKAEKSNSMAGLSITSRLLILVLVFALASVPWFFLPVTKMSFLLLGAELLLLLIYPLKPFRLKQYPLLAIHIDAMYAFAIPAVLAFYTYRLYYGLSFPENYNWILFGWALFIGIRQIIYHHVADMKNDLKSGTPNLALQFSPEALNSYIRRYVVPPELFFGIAFFLNYRAQEPVFTGVLIGSYICLFIPVFSLTPFKYFPQHVFGSFKSDRFYSHYWSIISLVVLSYSNTWFIVVLAAVILLFTSLSAHFFVRYFIVDFCIKNSKDFGSFVVNHSIYFFRKYILMKDEKASREGFYEDWLDGQTRRKRGIIAIVNANENKYTETFVRQHKKLPFFIHYYFGSDFPLWHQHDGNLISNNAELLSTKKTINTWLQQDEENYNLKILAEHLQKNNVQLLLCEFGTTGAKLAGIPELTGIPMIVIFYGYDAHHDKIIKENLEDYQKLFQNAVLIIGVSKDILLKLKNLGGAEEKLYYLPCSFDNELFQFSDHSNNKPVFLSVGRFAETKAPHLTILAFNEVQKTAPDARLVMVGKDGGGELFEACNILVRALGIENKVVFKGILSPEQVYEEMKNAYCFVQHSVTTPLHGDKEGTPVSVMEAMACGLPLIATRHAGIAEIIEHEKTGILVDEYDYIKMAAEMLKIIDNRQTAKQLGYAASQSIKNNPLFLANKELLTEIIERHKLK